MLPNSLLKTTSIRFVDPLTQYSFVKVKAAYDIKQKLETKFLRDEADQSHVFTVDDISPKIPTTVYWKGCVRGDYKVAPNVSIVKVLIEDCHDCTIDLRGKVLTNIVEVWKCNNVVLKVY